MDLEMKSSSQNHFTQITMVFLPSEHVVSVISSIDTGFALPAIADFEKLITPKQKRLICNPGNQRVICILKKK
jgi:hypothetical protein